MEKSSALNEIKRLVDLIGKCVQPAFRLQCIVGSSQQVCESETVVKALELCNNISKAAKLGCKKFKLKKDEDIDTFMSDFYDFEQNLIATWYEKNAQNELAKRMKSMEEEERESHGDTWHLGRGVD